MVEMVDLWIVYSIRLISWVVTQITLGNIFYVQIRAVINETPILVNIVKVSMILSKNGVYTCFQGQWLDYRLLEQFSVYIYSQFAN
jgi:hypothetical protein